MKIAALVLVYVIGAGFGFVMALRVEAEKIANGESRFMSNRTFGYPERTFFMTLLWPLMIPMYGLGTVANRLIPQYIEQANARKAAAAVLEAQRRRDEAEVERLMKEIAL